MNDERIWPDVVIPPGELLAETLEFLGMTQTELGRRSARPVQAINEIIKGTKEITPETAIQLEKVLGVPAHVWVRLEADYRYNLTRLRDGADLDKERTNADSYPYKEMADLGWIPKVADSRQRVLELLKFFRTSSLRLLESRDAAVAWRKSPTLGGSAEALSAWLMKGEREAEGIQVPTFNRALLMASLSELRNLTREETGTFSPRLVELLARCGVVLVFVRHLPGTGVQGATQWLGQRPVIQLSVRGKWSDIFWFSLFHELGHLIHHHKGVFINPEAKKKGLQEREADKFASDELIPPDRYRGFLKMGSAPTAPHVMAFAQELGIAPGIVVGRLQHDSLLRYSQLNQLRTKLELVER
jgi:HTH-type transcriptional regulator/antitoxin HigA